MPLYRHTCAGCGALTVDLQPLDAEPPLHCSSPMVRLMPRRVVGRVVNPSAGPSTSSNPPPESARPDTLRHVRTLERVESAAPICATKPELPTLDPSQPSVPWASSVGWKPAADRNAGERDASWRDDCEAMTEWHAQWLERDGVDRGAALRKASATQQGVIEQARTEVEAS